MGKLILKSFEVLSYIFTSPNHEDFNEEVDVRIKQENKQWNEIFKLYIFSYKRLEQYEKSSDEEGLYLRFTLIMKYYDEKIIEKHIQQILDKCNRAPVEKRYNCLCFYLKNEHEEDLYY